MSLKRMKDKGFTLIEAMVVLAMMVIFLTLGVPSYQNLVMKKRLESAAASLSSSLNQARASSIKSSKSIYLTFTNGTNWCYGTSDTTVQCDCAATNGCQVASQNTMVKSIDYKGLTLKTTVQGTTYTTGNQYNLYDPRRGLPQDSGDFTLTNSNNDSITVVLRKTGRINLCSDSFTKYPGC